MFSVTKCCQQLQLGQILSNESNFVFILKFLKGSTSKVRLDELWSTFQKSELKKTERPSEICHEGWVHKQAT